MKSGIVLGIAGLIIGLAAGYSLRGQSGANNQNTSANHTENPAAKTKEAASSKEKDSKNTAGTPKATLRDLGAFLGPLRKPKVPDDNELTDAKIELGRLLYWDPRLSGNGALSCATCHHPALGWSDG